MRSLFVKKKLIRFDWAIKTLLRDKVELRREFIQNHALEVAELDV